MFDEIREKYPKAYEKYALDFNYKYNKQNCNCSLYKFFDEQGIYIEIFSAPNPRCFFTQINRHPPMVIPKYNTRQEAEQAAFTKAFEILEERANGK